VRQAQLVRWATVALFLLTLTAVSGVVLVLRYAAVGLAGGGGADSIAAADVLFRPIPLLNMLIAVSFAASAALLLSSGLWKRRDQRLRQVTTLLVLPALLLWVIGIATSHGNHLLILLVAAGWALLGLAAWRLRADLHSGGASL